MIRNPLPTLESIRDAIMDITRFLSGLPRFDVISLEVYAVASGSVTALVTSAKMGTLWGAVQIGGTTSDFPAIAYYNNKTVQATYSYGASTSGKQTYRFLLVGV